jgi:predicted ATPase
MAITPKSPGILSRQTRDDMVRGPPSTTLASCSYLRVQRTSGLACLGRLAWQMELHGGSPMTDPSKSPRVRIVSRRKKAIEPDSRSSTTLPVPAVTRVALKNFKSIESCSVRLLPMTLLVGPNGAGKSNFVDGLRITSDAMNSNLENAIRERGGVTEVRRRSRGHPTHFGVRLDLDLGNGQSASYAYQVAARRGQTIEVQKEECRVRRDGALTATFTAEKGRLRTSVPGVAPLKVAPNSLALPLLSGTPEFQVIHHAISNIGYYSLNLDRVRELQSADMGNLLLRDGSNLASVIRQTGERSPETLERITEYLAAVVPGIHAISAKVLGPKETIEFRQEVTGDPNPWRYLAASVSDGTLRALGVLVAVFQVAIAPPGIPMVAIEEPEVAVHPGAALRLMDALLEASRSRQLLLTTHSPDLLDHPGLNVESVIAVQSSGGTSVLGPVEVATRDAVRQNLYTVGELLRLEQVRPDMFAIDQWSQPKLFA